MHCVYYTPTGTHVVFVEQSYIFYLFKNLGACQRHCNVYSWFSLSPF